MASVKVIVKAPGPSPVPTVVQRTFGTDGDFVDPITLPTGRTGTYTVTIDPQGASMGNVTLTFYNGATCKTYSADEPNRLRGPQHDGGWCDEIAACREGEIPLNSPAETAPPHLWGHVHEGVLAEAAEGRLAADHRSPAVLAGAEPKRVAPRGEVAPVDGHLPAGPDLVLAFLADTVTHDDIGLALAPGQRVGSRLQLDVPAALSYGDQYGDLRFVVDILAAS